MTVLFSLMVDQVDALCFVFLRSNSVLPTSHRTTLLP